MQGVKRELGDAGSSGMGGAKRPRQDNRGRDITLRFLLQSKNAGGIIGKGGQNIKRLRSEYSATVNVPDSMSSERILSIQSSDENAVAILKECFPQMGEPPYSGLNKQPNQGQHEINFLIHSSQAGSVIGTGGSKIKELREKTGCQIKIFSDCLPGATERVVAIAGNPDEVVSAMENILETMSKTPIKGPVSLYDPTPQDEYDDYGGYGGGPPMGMRGGMRGGGVGMRGGRGGQVGRGGGFGGGPGFGARGRGRGLLPDESVFNQQMNDEGNYTDFQDPSGQQTTQVTIPKDLAGAIIGRGGERIRSIRQRSGADIKIEEPDPNIKDRVITIKGNEEQIQYAQFLMQQRSLPFY
ncbi:heterogeneous nuclear ribonucleoprotein K-like isoform X2 [Rhopilema esculentum]|uniref:heterogeneous nuclear ribonucleoprotein K-like isoform X2 n=1 Tax=Rhopilema esculentum TaxID=499914 RepID=UPI0031E45188